MPDGRLERTRRAYRLDLEPEQAGAQWQKVLLGSPSDGLLDYFWYAPDGTLCSDVVKVPAPIKDKGKGECPAGRPFGSWSDDALKLYHADIESGVRCVCGSLFGHPHAPECKEKGECPAYG